MRVFFITICIINFMFGGLINKIAVIVNNEPITMYDIDKKANTLGVDNQEALNILIDDILYKQELRKNNIEVDIFDIDKYIEKLAKLNNLTLFEFKNAIRQQTDYNKFISNIKQKIVSQKLIEKIAAGKIRLANEEDLKIYYNNHKNQFKIPTKIVFSKYQSKKKYLLEKIKQNPLFYSDEIKTSINITKNFDEFSDEAKFIIQQTKKHSFSPIFIDEKMYNLYYISDKKEFKTIPFKDVKNKIFQIVMKQREDEFLKDYFTKLRLKADIVKLIQ